MSIFNFISNIFKPAVDLIDELHTSDEEKLRMQSILKKVENDFNSKILEYESRWKPRPRLYAPKQTDSPGLCYKSVSVAM